MPFTLAHPAIVIPLSKTKWNLSLTAMVIGSMSPDFEFFIQMREVENIGHHWYGILLFDLPITILACYLFHNLLRNSFLANLPEIYRKRFIHFQNFDWNSYAIQNKLRVIASVFIGIFSHFAWDAFTHHDGFMVELIPFLSTSIEIMRHSVPVYFLLQIFFSITGLVVVHNQLMQMPIQQNATPKSSMDHRYWVGFAVLFLTIASTRFLMWPEFNSFGGIMIAIMGSILYSWIPVSIIYKIHLQLKTSNHEYQ
jgi:hypothetical protein